MMALASIVTITYVLGQGFLLWALLKFVKSFGAFVESHERSTKQLLLTHESNLIVHRSNLEMLGKLTELATHQKERIA